MIVRILNEDADQLVQAIEAGDVPKGAFALLTESDTEIDKALARSLNVAKRQAKYGLKRAQGSYPNILIVGEAGAGKTSIVRQFFQGKEIDGKPIEVIALKAANLDETDLGGAIAGDLNKQVAVRLSSTELDQLSPVKVNENGEKEIDHYTVLFLDELNRAPRTVRGTLLTLVAEHLIDDSREANRERFLDGLLFTVAAINPPGDKSASNGYFADELDQAEWDRFRRINFSGSPKSTYNYLAKKYWKLFNESDDMQEKGEIVGRLNIAKALLTNPDNMPGIGFDTVADLEQAASDSFWNHKSYSPRSLERTLEECDGTVSDFMDVYTSEGNNLKTEVIENALNTYFTEHSAEIDDMLNLALQSITLDKNGLPKMDSSAKARQDFSEKTLGQMLNDSDLD